MASDDVAYYRQRAISERVNARNADRAEIAEIHEELVRLYDALIEYEQLRPTLRFQQSIASRSRLFSHPPQLHFLTLLAAES
jgi:hypothetical protein